MRRPERKRNRVTEDMFGHNATHKMVVKALREPGILHELAVAYAGEERLTNPHRELSQEEVNNIEWIFTKLASPELPYGTIEALALLLRILLRIIWG